MGQLQLFSPHRRPRTEMFLTFSLFQTFTIPSETSTTWPTIHHREELRQPQPPAGRQQRGELEEGGHDQHHYLPLQKRLQQSQNITNMTTITTTTEVTM